MTIPKIVVADANVLLSGTIRDFLLDAALAGLVDVYWSEHILDEFRRHAIERFEDIDVEKTIKAFGKYFPNAKVEPSPEVVQKVESVGGWHRDRDDIMVVAAAVQAGAHSVLTENIKHFPTYSMNKLGLAAQKPGTVLAELAAQTPKPFIETFEGKAKRIKERWGEGPEGTLATLIRDKQYPFAEKLGEIANVRVPTRDEAEAMKRRRDEVTNTINQTQTDSANQESKAQNKLTSPHLQSPETPSEAICLNQPEEPYVDEAYFTDRKTGHKFTVKCRLGDHKGDFHISEEINKYSGEPFRWRD